MQVTATEDDTGTKLLWNWYSETCLKRNPDYMETCLYKKIFLVPRI